MIYRGFSTRLMWFLWIVVALLALGRLGTVFSSVLLDYNEGWNAFQAAAAMGKGALYPPANGFTANNYPPLSFYAVSFFSKFFGDLIVSGRIVSLISVIVVSGAIHAAIGRIVPERRIFPWLGCLIFLLFNVTVFRSYVAMNDPQWMGHAFMMAGVLALIWRAPEKRVPLPAIIMFSLMMFLGMLVKHNIVAIPLSVAIWLLSFDRRAFFICLVMAILSVVAIAALDGLLFDGNMIASVIEFKRSYSLDRMLLHSLVAILFIPMTLCSGQLWHERRWDRRAGLLVIGIWVSLLLGVLQGSGSGVDINAYFETLLFLSIACPVALALRSSSAWGRRFRFLLALPLAILIPYGAVVSAGEIRGKAESVATAEAMISRIRMMPGPVACEDLALCYWAGKNFEVDFFSTRQKLAQGEFRKRFHDAIANHDYSAIEMKNMMPGTDENSVRMLISEHYHLLYERGDMGIYVPNLSGRMAGQ